jgi:hypothetical protein
VAAHDSNTFIKFAYNMIVVGPLEVWCQDNNLFLNVGKTKNLIVDYRKRRAEHAPFTLTWLK